MASPIPSMLADKIKSIPGLPPDFDPQTVFDLLPRVHIESSIGAVLIGTLIELIFFGNNVHQAYQYFRLHPSDKPIFRWAVIGVVVLEMVHSALNLHICYHYLVANYLRPKMLLFGVWSLSMLPMCLGAIVIITQSVLVYRVYSMGPMYQWLGRIARILVVGEIGLAAALTVQAFMTPTLAESATLSWMISSVYNTALAVDTIIAACLLKGVWDSRALVDWTKKSLLDVLAIYLVNTGVSTVACSLLASAFAFALSNNGVYIGFVTVVAQLYGLSLLSMLNSRSPPADQTMNDVDKKNTHMKEPAEK